MGGSGGSGAHREFQWKSCRLIMRMIQSVTTPMNRMTSTRAKIWSTCEPLARGGDR